MEILIFSAGRSAIPLHTAEQLMHARVPFTLVVQDGEAAAYRDGHGYPMWVLPKHTPKTLPAARAHVVKATRDEGGLDQKILMLDDDLNFAVRREDDDEKFRAATPKDIKQLIAVMAKALDKYAHVGVCSREGGNRITTDQQATRMSRVLAYNTALVPADVQFDRVLLPEDFDVTLQLLYRNLPNLVLSGWCHNQPGSNTDGGCSVYRTIEVHNAAMLAFGALHPGIVKIVDKQTKTSWGGQPRKDAHVQWKKALALGQAAARGEKPWSW